MHKALLTQYPIWDGFGIPSVSLRKITGVNPSP